MLAIISAPIWAILSQGAVIAKLARERTGADQLAQTQIESLRSLPYYQVGLVRRQPVGQLAASTPPRLPGGEPVTITRADHVGADRFREPVLDERRLQEGRRHGHAAQRRPSCSRRRRRYVASASAPPYAGSTWVQIKRTVHGRRDDVAARRRERRTSPAARNRRADEPHRHDRRLGHGALPGARQQLERRTLVYTLATTLSGYSVFPDDISPGAPSSVPSTARPQLDRDHPDVQGDVADGECPDVRRGRVHERSDRLARLVALRHPDGEHPVRAELGDDHARATRTEPALVPLPPNVLGQTFRSTTYYVTAWSTSGTTGYWSPGTAGDRSVELPDDADAEP